MALRGDDGGDIQLGLTIAFTEEEIGRRKFGRALAPWDTTIWMPRDPKKWPLKDSDDGIGRTTVPGAYNVEIIRFLPGSSDSPGKCSGRLSVYYDYEEKPLWVTGTFKNVDCGRGRTRTITAETDGGKDGPAAR